MSLKDEERATLVNLYLGKSAETLEDARLSLFSPLFPLVSVLFSS